ncbi:MAG: twin-arginine translocase TatA/TatE family subunit [Bacteroidales bacterium]|nr:twin-arginine translocase TatA/TatE family subunit [Bacteroidales bacterium]MCM1147968.1 twin-arginine translocase TatA/TatE family subunit [Bacteroidales bacterium]MCM1206892.1 twin-arginine translocase TatA/TatE family subunit [Bacillota bacterium]MCM1509525.1 twin-arginine translocase TatA/TatE family subunit [Clostridium sp.]
MTDILFAPILFIGTTELLLIGGMALLLFGGKKLPEMMRGLGQGVKEFKKGVNGQDEEPDDELTLTENPNSPVTDVDGERQEGRTGEINDRGQNERRE